MKEPRDSMQERIRNKAVEILRENPQGLRYSELMRKLQEGFPATPPKTIYGSAWDLDATRPQSTYKPARGLFRYKPEGIPEGAAEEVIGGKPVEPPPTPKEKDFYDTFAAYLKGELEGGVRESIPLGGSYTRTRWGTPDVVAVYKPSKKAVIQFPAEIISAEIKINPDEGVTAFGQAIAYRLFSSKVYVVLPQSDDKIGLARLEALCLLFGLGLVLFKVDVNRPDFEIRVRAQRFIPDMYYVNEFINKLADSNPKGFNILFPEYAE